MTEGEKTALQRVVDQLDKRSGERKSRNPDMLPMILAEQLTDPKNVEMYTEFTRGEVLYFAKRAALSEMLANDALPDEIEKDGRTIPNPDKKHGLVFVDAFRKHYARLNKSLDRKSSNEIRDMVKTNTHITTQGMLGASLMNPAGIDEQKQKHWWSRFFGGQ